MTLEQWESVMKNCGQSIYSLGRLEKRERNFRRENPHLPVIRMAYSDNMLYEMYFIRKTAILFEPQLMKDDHCAPQKVAKMPHNPFSMNRGLSIFQG